MSALACAEFFFRSSSSFKLSAAAHASCSSSDGSGELSSDKPFNFLLMLLFLKTSSKLEPNASLKLLKILLWDGLDGTSTEESVSSNGSAILKGSSYL